MHIQHSKIVIDGIEVDTANFFFADTFGEDTKERDVINIAIKYLREKIFSSVKFKYKNKSNIKS